MKAVMIGMGAAGENFLNLVHNNLAYVCEGKLVQLEAVFDRSPNTVWNGYKVKPESELKKYLEKQSDEIKVVIASQFVDFIIERLKE